MTTNPTVVRSHDTQPMQVKNMTFMVNRLGQDCAPLQFLRELTKNAIEGIQQLDNASGEICWDVDWNRYDLTGVFKLCVTDNGIGMTGPEMVEYINNLSSSIHEQTDEGNFGVGAKISAVPLNPEGLIYLSWKDGKGAMIHLWFDSDERIYGLRRFAENHGEFWLPIEDSIKPDPIEEHGTMVILLGRDSDDDTMQPPEETAMRSRWVLRYLNTRFFRFPTGITAKAREGWEVPRDDSRHNFLRQVTGQGPWIEKNSQSSGTVKLSNATAHWWILRADVDSDSGHTAPGGHMAALYHDELYEMTVRRGGAAKLQGFGVIFGCDRVVIYVEPDTDSHTVVSNTARTHLLIDGEAIDWSQWAAEFREQMPDDLVALQEEIGAAAGQTDHRKAIRERLKHIRELLKFSRFRPKKDGSVRIVPDNAEIGGETQKADQQRKEHAGGGRGGRGGRAGDIYALFAEQHGDPAEPVAGEIEPKVDWLTVEAGTRIPPDLDDRAARYLVDQNRLLINGDCRIFTDMIDRWVVKYADVSGCRATVQGIVREWFEQQLMETVMSALALRRTGQWSAQELGQLWTEEALTAAVLPRYHIDVSIRRALGNKLGKLKAA